jgi:hypothetical protein
MTDRLVVVGGGGGFIGGHLVATLRARGELGDELRTELEARGHDGMVITVPGEPTELVVFRPAQIAQVCEVAAEEVAPAPGAEAALGSAPPSEAERAANFRAWLGASRAVDAQGRPLTLYHGTMADFDAFDFTRLGEASEHPTAMLGAFFSTNPETAAHWAWDPEAGANLMPVHLAIERPLELSGEVFRTLAADESLRALRPRVEALRAQLRAGGHDGIHVRAISGASGADIEFAGDLWIATSPHQIKSAIGNVGTYDPDNADVRFARDAGAALAPTHGMGPVPPNSRTDLDTASFRQWFGKSQIVDAKGAPLVVVHATLHDFAAFELGRGEAQSDGHFFAARELTNHYLWSYLDAVKYQAQEQPGNHFFMPLYLSIQNPKRINTTGTGAWADPDEENAQISRARQEGHDGLILRDDEQDTTFYVAFAPTQIKSALSNNGEYSLSNPDIRFASTASQPVQGAQPTMATPLDAAEVARQLAACDDGVDAEAVALAYAGGHDPYLHGECHLLALALHELTGAPLYAVMETEGERAGCLVHAFVAAGDHVVDLRGRRTREMMLQDFETLAPYLTPIDPEELAQLGACQTLRQLAAEIEAATPVANVVHQIATHQRTLAGRPMQRAREPAPQAAIEP